MSAKEISVIPTDFTFSEDDLKLKEIPVTLGKGQYVLREADEHAAVTYRNFVMKNMKMEDGKFSGTGAGLADGEPQLVGACLFPSGGGAAVGDKFVRGLPARIVKPLFDWVQEVSGLKAKEGEEGNTVGKEEQPPTTDNSV